MTYPPEAVLADTSVVHWAARVAGVRTYLEDLAERGLLATCTPVDAEVAASARSRRVFRVIIAQRAGLLIDLPLTPSVAARARDVQELAARQGFVQTVAPAVWTVAACADVHGVLLLHYDRDLDRIAAVSGQPARWLAPPGTLA